MIDSEIYSMNQELKDLLKKDSDEISGCLRGEILDKYKELLALEIDHLENMKSEIERLYSERI